jgi:hypothetical protein
LNRVSGLEHFAVDPLDWEDHASRVKYIEGLSEFEKKHAADSIRYLSTTLGDSFLRRLSSKEGEGLPHPLLALLLNVVAWTRQELIRLAENIRTLEQSPNLKKLLSGLEQPELFAHNSLVLSSAACLVREGFRATFEPTMPLANNQKQPDIRLCNLVTAEEVFLEIAVTTASQRERDAHECSYALFNKLFRFGAGLRWCGRLRKIPAPMHLEEILSKIDQALNRVGSEKRLISVVEEGTIELAVCPEDQIESLELWGNERGIRTGGFQGPPFPADHVARLRRKIATEQGQLPHEGISTLLIQDSDIFLRTNDIRALISELEEEVYRYPRLALVVVRGSSIGGPEPEVIQKDQHRFTRKVVGNVCEQTLLLLNRFCSTPLSPSTISAFWRAF